MKKNFLTFLACVFVVLVLIWDWSNGKLDPISSVKEHDVDGKTYEQILSQSGRCENPQWVQDTPKITWQDHTLSDSIKVSVTCHSKGAVTLLDKFKDEGEIFNLILSKTINSSEFEEARIRYKEKMTKNSPPYDENRLKQLVRELCKFPDVNDFPKFVNALRDPRDSCKPTESQEAKLKGEFSLESGAPSAYILMPFYKAYATEVAQQNASLNNTKTGEVLDIEEKTTFSVQYQKKGRSGRRMRNTHYNVYAGGEYYVLKINGKVKKERSHPSVSEIFERPLEF